MIFSRIRFYRVLFFICLCLVAGFAAGRAVANGGEAPKAAAPQALLKETQTVIFTDTDVVETTVTEAVPLVRPAPDLSYRLGVGDVLGVTVYGEPELTDSYKVDQSGTISMPLIGEVHVNGLSLREAEKIIAAKLSEGYLVEPSVSIQIAQHRPFYILGEVRAPGSYSYVGNMSVLNAVALAGGFTYRANRDKVEILRAQAGHTDKDMSYKKMPVESKVLPGDIILIKERFF